MIMINFEFEFEITRAIAIDISRVAAHVLRACGHGLNSSRDVLAVVAGL